MTKLIYIHLKFIAYTEIIETLIEQTLWIQKKSTEKVLFEDYNIKNEI